MIKTRYNVKVSHMEVKDEGSTEKAVSNADIVVATASEGVQVLGKRIWRKADRIKMLVDINAVAPYGIEEVKPNDDLRKMKGKMCLGALAVGGLKMRCQIELISRLFDQKDVVFDLLKVYSISKELV